MPEILKNIKAEDRLKKIRIVSENDDVMGGQPEADGMKENDNNAIFDLACTAQFTIEELDKQSEILTDLPISSGYSSTRKYRPGELVFIDGVWHECYNPDGCLGKDPRDPANRPSGWTNQDRNAPYHWVEIGKFLMLPEIGSPIYLMNTSPREGLIKLRNDGELSATKFWRIAELNPNIVKDGLLEVADLRANVIRALDEGKGVDVGRVINSYQEDATQMVTGTLNGIAHGLDWGGASGVFSRTKNLNKGNGVDGGSSHQIIFDNSVSVRTSTEERVKNIAMLACIRI